MSHSAEKLRRGALQCVINFGYQKILCFSRGLCHDFPSKFCCLTVPKNFVGEPFFVLQNFWYGKNLWMRKLGVSKNCMHNRGYHDFLSKIFCPTVPKIFVGEPFSVSLVWGMENFYASESYVTIFCRNLFLTVPKNFVEEPF